MTISLVFEIKICLIYREIREAGDIFVDGAGNFRKQGNKYSTSFYFDI